MDTQSFYDSLASTYHYLYRDWEEELVSQAKALDGMLGIPSPGATIADTACGIGTQLLGLANLGYQVFGSDISLAAIVRARREATTRGVRVELAVADMRALPWEHRSMDAAICADNALPHLLTDDDVIQAFTELARVLRPGACALVTTRDYDAVLKDRPTSTPPQITDVLGAGRRVVSFQRWSWRDNTDIYDLEHFQLMEHDRSWTTRRRTATYRAYTQEHLATLARRAGMSQATWVSPEESGYFQPAMIVTPASRNAPG
ncbi:class I SAM-dependent methyltransferase [Tessaracoccus sp. MC1627]|uniref:class I SAM-dependent methyltransferase n=1 Tax=Tessaracoccus sp. MC1627 TaxID=2760312 RepID=UPI0015FF674A|nr:class I SAM-dependent methyltransferase [Tessaracoccus sp. MC1627]MBB1513758.1 class I SAM-dependent methyltransferase [Tessaracoccus sp. MC1627]